MKILNIVGTAKVVEVKSRKLVETIPFNFNVGSKSMVKAQFKYMGLYKKYNTTDYEILYNYEKVTNLPFILNYGIESVGKLVK